MSPNEDAPRLEPVWLAMADHFLDTETRHDIPLTALRCVEAGLTSEQAQRVWQDDVSPAVGMNLWSVAGEWAGWDRDWLVKRIERRRASWWYGAKRARTLSYWLSLPVNHGEWVAIARCMKLLLGVPCDERQQTARDLELLARFYFDFCPPRSNLPHAQLARLSELRSGPFFEIVEPATQLTEKFAARRRVDAALEVAQ